MRQFAARQSATFSNSTLFNTLEPLAKNLHLGCEFHILPLNAVTNLTAFFLFQTLTISLNEGVNMTLSINQDFLNIKQLDIESKLIEPTSRLVAQLNAQLNSLYVETEAKLRELHTEIAIISKQAYEQPVETFTALYDQSVEECNEVYVLFREEVLPKAEVVCQQIAAKVSDAGDKTLAFGQALLDDPQATVASSVDKISVSFNTGLDASQAIIDTISAQLTAWSSMAMQVTEENALSLYYAAGEILKLLLEQPWETVQALFYNTLSSLLDVYFQAVSSLISFA
jgi:hypothetical protein